MVLQYPNVIAGKQLRLTFFLQVAILTSLLPLTELIGDTQFNTWRLAVLKNSKVIKYRKAL